MLVKHLIIPLVLSLTILLSACGNVPQKDSESSSVSSSVVESTSTSAEPSDTSAGVPENYPVSFAKDSSSWRKAYLNKLISENLLDGDDESEDYLYSFIYVDGDDVPELVVSSEIEATGNHLLTYHDGTVDMLQTSRLGFTFIPGKNLLDNGDGVMGWYHDYVYSIKNGKWTCVFRGDYGETEDGDKDVQEDEATRRYIYPRYSIDDSKVTYEDYYKQLDALYDSKKAVEPEHYYTADDCKALLKTGHLASYGHKYELVTGDCSWTNAYKRAKEAGGYLASITSDEEFDAVTKQIRDEGKKNYSFWIGMTRDSSYTGNDFDYEWIDPSLTQKSGTRSLAHWYDGMPSYSEKLPNGTEVQDHYVELIYRKADDAFYFNDTFDDPISVYPSFAGHMGYIIEFDNVKDEKAYQAKSASKEDGSNDYCHDLAKKYGNFAVAISDGYPSEGSDYYSVPVEVDVSDEDAVIGHSVGKTTVRIRKDAKVLYEDGEGEGPRLITLDEYVSKLSAPDFKSCDQIRIWYDDTAGAEETYQIYYDDKGYITQFYDGAFE